MDQIQRERVIVICVLLAYRCFQCPRGKAAACAVRRIALRAPACSYELNFVPVFFCWLLGAATESWSIVSCRVCVRAFLLCFHGVWVDTVTRFVVLCARSIGIGAWAIFWRIALVC